MPAKRRMDKQFGIAYHSSNRMLRITIPDSIHLPSTRVWIRLRDSYTVVISENKPESTANWYHVALGSYKTKQGCREANIGPISHGIGEPFRMAAVTYSVIDGRFHLKLPDTESRVPPVQRRKQPQKEEAKAIPVPEPLGLELPSTSTEAALVLIERANRLLEYQVPLDELAKVLGDWALKGYQKKGDC